jgi:HK97 family phage portal protein
VSFFQRLFKRNFTTSIQVADRKEYFQNRLNAVTGIRGFNHDSPESCSTVYAAVNIIANTVAKLPLTIYKKTSKGKVPMQEHRWFNALTYSPVGNLSRTKWIANAITDLYFNGNYFALKQEFSADLLSEKKDLKPLGKLKSAVQYENEVYYSFENVKGWIPSRDLIHFYLISKDNGITGLNPIAAIRNELEIQHGSEQTTINFFKQGSFSVLYVESDLADADKVGAGSGNKQAIKEHFKRIEEEFSGYLQAGKIQYIPPMLRLKSLPLPDLKYLENSRFTISQIGAIFNVPSIYLGVQDSSSPAKAEEQVLAFKNLCISSVCNIIRSELEQKLLTTEERNAGVTIDFDYSALYTVDLISKASYFEKLRQQGAITPNEIREQFGFERSDSEYMDHHFIQSQNQSIELYKNWMNNSLGGTPPAQHQVENKDPQN